MNLDLIDENMPVELRRQIHGFIPYKNCVVCNCTVVEFSGSPDMYICSIGCLNKFNKDMLKRLKYNAAVIFSCQVARMSRYAMTMTYIFITVTTAFICPLSLGVFMIYHTMRLILLLLIRFLIR